MKYIYLDNAATTKIDEDVLTSMLPYLHDSYGNASSIYKLGRDSREAIDISRDSISKILNSKSNEIFFTSGGTEGDNWAIKGVASANKEKGKHIITTCIEHHAVLNTCEYLKKEGYDITYLPVKENGIIDLEDLKQSIRQDTILVSVMFANNEIGTIQPISEIAKITREKGIYLHTDAVQAVGILPIDVKEMGIDILTFSGHKIHGPKGVGVMYIRDGVKINKYMHGGHQEFGKRAGTENVAGIVGIAKALEIANRDMESNSKKIKAIREYALNKLLEIPETILNGDREKRLPGNINVCFKYIEGESILLMLDANNIYASSGSACTSGSLEPSHVLLAIGLPHEIAHGSLRLTFSKYNTKEDVDYLFSVLSGIIQRLRDMSPLYLKEK